MRKLWIGISIIVVVALVIVLVVTQTKKEPEEVKIGAILPLTGDAAKYGQWIREGAELAKKEVNHDGGVKGHPLRIIYEDDQAMPSKATLAMRKLIGVDKVPIVFGSWASSAVLSQAPIAQREKVVVLANAMSPKIREAGDYIFRITPDVRYSIDPLLRHVAERGYRKAAVLYINNDYGVDAAQVFQEKLEAAGGKVIFSEAYSPDQTDFRTVLSKINRSEADCVFLPGYTEVGYILKQALELGIQTKFYATMTFENPDILKIAGNAAEGVIFPNYFDPKSTDPEMLTYQNAYRTEYGRESEGFAAEAYTAIKIIAHVMSKWGTDSESLRMGLNELSDFPSVFGPIKFDEMGDIVMPFKLRTIWGGKYVPLAY